mmetsp:Transcript_22476/g.63679  ORF Transcript_22476/g.63679 Transcript_22476/m.63679 type:complete len:426 (-) Transcript_22476:212-1489(-)
MTADSSASKSASALAVTAHPPEEILLSDLQERKRISSMDDSGTLFFDQLQQRFLYPSLKAALDGNTKEDQTPSPAVRRSTLSSLGSSFATRTSVQSMLINIGTSTRSLFADDDPATNQTVGTCTSSITTTTRSSVVGDAPTPILIRSPSSSLRGRGRAGNLNIIAAANRHVSSGNGYTSFGSDPATLAAINGCGSSTQETNSELNKTAATASACPSGNSRSNNKNDSCPPRIPVRLASLTSPVTPRTAKTLASSSSSILSASTISSNGSRYQYYYGNSNNNDASNAIPAGSSSTHDTMPRKPIRIQSLRSIQSIKEEPDAESKYYRSRGSVGSIREVPPPPPALLSATHANDDGDDNNDGVVSTFRHHHHAIPQTRLSTIESIGLLSENFDFEDDEDSTVLSLMQDQNDADAKNWQSNDLSNVLN